MPTAHKNIRAAMTTGGVTAYTCPVGTIARFTMLQVANVDGTNSADATVQWTDSSDGGTVTRLCYQNTIRAKDALSVMSGGLILEAGDTLVGIASANSDLELTGSLQEVS